MIEDIRARSLGTEKRYPADSTWTQYQRRLLRGTLKVDSRGLVNADEVMKMKGSIVEVRKRNYPIRTSYQRF